MRLTDGTPDAVERPDVTGAPGADATLARWLAYGALLTPLPSVLGWLMGVRWLVQPLATFAPARVWGTLMIPLGALAMLSKLRGARRTARWLAVACAAAALTGLLVAVFGGQLPFEAAAMARIGVTVTDSTRAIPLSVGVLFLLYSAAVYLLASDPPSDRQLLVAGALASTQLAMAGVLFMSQLAGLFDGVALLLRAPLHAVVAALALGGALLQRATAREHRTLAPPRWAPVLVGVSTALVVMVLWQALRAREEAQTRSQEAISITALERAVARQYRTVNRALGRIAVYLAASPAAIDPVWTTTFPRLIEETDGLQRLVWIDTAGRLLRTAPATPLTAAEHAALARFARRALPGGALADTTTAAHSVSLDGPWRLALWTQVPSPRFGPTRLLAIVDERQLLQLFSQESRETLAIRVTDGDSVLVETGRVAPTALTRPLQIGPRRLAVALSDRRASARSPLPDVVLALGLAVALLLAVTLWLQRRIWEQARVEGMARMQRAIERATDGVWELDVQRGSTHRSPGLLRYLGIDPARLEQGMAAWFALVHPEDAPRVTERLAQHLRGETEAFECEYRLQAGDGTWHTLVDRGRVVERQADGRPVRVLGISADVTERSRADAAREESERRFRAMFETANQLQLLLDLDGTVLEANQAAADLAGVAADHLQGRPFAQAPWWSGDESTVERVQERFIRARNGETLRFEVDLQAGRDRPITVDFSLKPLRDGAQRVAQVLAEGRDLTVRKRAEESLREISTLTTMGQLAARVAHEINNPLAGIQNAFLLIRGAIPTDHPHYRFVGAIEREIGRIAAVTRQLYETYRPDALMARQASVIIAISDAVSFLEQVNRGRPVTIQTNVTRAPSLLPVPDALLRQTLYNLVQNAVDVSPVDGIVQVTAWQDGDECVLTVADQGPGIPHAIRDRIFDPFFSTKDRTMKTGGMGIGLALVRQSVLAVGGRIDLRDRPGGGTEFEVRLPMTPLDTGALQ